MSAQWVYISLGTLGSFRTTLTSSSTSLDCIKHQKICLEKLYKTVCMINESMVLLTNVDNLWRLKIYQTKASRTITNCVCENYCDFDGRLQTPDMCTVALLSLWKSLSHFYLFPHDLLRLFVWQFSLLFRRDSGRF